MNQTDQDPCNSKLLEVANRYESLISSLITSAPIPSDKPELMRKENEVWWTPSFGPENAEIKLGSQALLD